MAGESLGPGLVLDFSRYLRRIVRIERRDGPRAAGRGPRAAQRPAAAAGRLFGPDPANSSVTTVGSMIAIDACGQPLAEVRLGRAATSCSLQVVLADGQLLELGREPLGPRRQRRRRAAQARAGQPPGRACWPSRPT